MENMILEVYLFKISIPDKFLLDKKIVRIDLKDYAYLGPDAVAGVISRRVLIDFVGESYSALFESNSRTYKWISGYGGIEGSNPLKFRSCCSGNKVDSSLFRANKIPLDEGNICF